LILAQTALETIPRELAQHPAVVADSKRRRKPPDEILLDRSVHHAAMSRLKEARSRGRPDIAYHVVLDVTCAPAYRCRSLKLYVHTRNDLVISLSEDVRPPKSYDRFRNLMEQLLVRRQVGEEKDLMTVKEMKLRDLIAEIKPGKVIGLSRLGNRADLHELVSGSMGKKPCFVVGGFPAGHFDDETTSLFHELCSIGGEGLEASLVVCRLVYEIEKSLGLG